MAKDSFPGPIPIPVADDKFFSAVPGQTFDMCMISTRTKTHYLLEKGIPLLGAPNASAKAKGESDDDDGFVEKMSSKKSKMLSEKLRHSDKSLDVLSGFQH